MRIESPLAALALLLVMAGILPTAAQSKSGFQCLEPTAQLQSDAASYLAKKNHFTSQTDLSLVKSEKANDACFWKLEFQTAGKTSIVVYLSPDRSFLATELYDLRVDPLLEERKHVESVMTSMLAGDPPLMGPAGAPVSIVEFSDFECPYCQRLKNMLELEVVPKAAGKVSIAFKNFPLPMHPWAKPAAMMAACAGLQDSPSFWKVHDFLFDNQKTITADNLNQKVEDFVATSATLDKAQFKKCVDKDMALGIVTNDMALGQKNGVHATPTVFINGVKYEGVQSAAQLLEIINSGGNQSVAPPASNTVSANTAPNMCVKPTAKSN